MPQNFTSMLQNNLNKSINEEDKSDNSKDSINI